MSDKRTQSSENVRLTYTRKAIKETYLRLAANADIGKITTVEICRETGINRNTFYSYFYSSEDVFNEIKNDLFNEIDEATKDETARTEEICIRILRILYKNIDFAKIIFTQNGNVELIYELFSKYRDKLLKRVERRVPNVTEKEKKMFYCYFVFGVSGTLREWLSNEYTYSPDDVSSFIIDYTVKGLNGLRDKHLT